MDKNVIIEHPDGRRYGTTEAAFKRLEDTAYKGFKILGEETDTDFLVSGVPAPRKPRKRPAAKKAAPVAKTVETPAETAAG